MIEINDLPVELYSLIFKNLSINDLFNCRLVNKKFKYSTYECVHELVISEFGLLEKYDNYWYYNNKLINEDNLINIKRFKSIRSLFNLNNNLKYLRINWYDNKDRQHPTIFHELNLNEELKCLNEFSNLECLEICTMDTFLKLNINLKNLKYFLINNLCGNYELNSPKLEKIQFYYIDKINIKGNLESIKHLIIYKDDNQLEQFKNLEIIEFINASLSSLNENLLSFFNNLKQLKIETYNSIESFNSELEDCLIKILNNRTKLKRSIDIYLEGVKLIINIEKLEEFKSCKSILEYQINNYDLLDLNIPRFTDLQYSQLNNLFHNLRNDLPSSFFDKYQNLSTVSVSNGDGELIDADNLNWFLNNLKCLRELELESVLLDQNFFNNLPNTIRYLCIVDYSEQSLYLNIDFNFIFKLTKLIDIILNTVSIQTDFFDLILKSFLNLKHLRRFVCFVENQRILVHRKNDYYYFDYIGEIKLDYNQFVSKLNEIKLEMDSDI